MQSSVHLRPEAAREYIEASIFTITKRTKESVATYMYLYIYLNRASDVRLRPKAEHFMTRRVSADTQASAAALHLLSSAFSIPRPTECHRPACSPSSLARSTVRSGAFHPNDSRGDPPTPISRAHKHADEGTERIAVAGNGQGCTNLRMIDLTRSFSRCGIALAAG